jgi:hypothetical protein
MRFSLRNINPGPINISLKSSATWIKLSFSDNAGKTMDVTVRLVVSGLTIGSYEEKIEVTSDGGNLTIKVLLEIVEKKTRVKLTLDNTVGLIDNIPQKPLECPPFIMGGKSYLPLRFVMEAFGAKVEWEQITNELNPKAFIRYIRIKSPSINIEYSSVDQTVFVDQQPLINNFQLIIRSSRAFVSTDFLAQTLGEVVFYSPDTRTYLIEY